MDVMASSSSPHDEKVYSPSRPKDTESQNVLEDAVFGEVVEGGTNYRSVGWKATVALMLKTQIGLGVLSIPSVFDTLGLIPGVICLIVIGIITGWSNYIVGVFKLRHPQVYGIDDVGKMLFGRFGQEVFGLAFALWWTCVAGSGMLSISIAFNTLSEHGACTAIFVAVAAIIGFSLASIPTLSKIAWIAWIGLFGILASILTVAIAVAVQDQPATAPRVEGAVWKSDYKLFGSPTFAEASASLCSLVFAFAGTSAFFNIVSEMRDPTYYTRAVMIQQACSSGFYCVIGIIVYYYCGSYVASPALGSAGPLMKKVCYGLALPGLIASTMLVTHITAKYMFIRTLRGTPHLSNNTKTHWITWFSYTAAVSLVAYIIASAVPVFGGLVSLVGAMFGTLMCFQPMGCMWLYDHWAEGKVKKSPKWIAMVCWSVFVIVAGSFLMIAGTYGSLVGIVDSYNKDGGTAAWTCADNSNST